MAGHLQEERVREAVERLNVAFHGRTLAPWFVYAWLETHGCSIDACVLVRFLPSDGFCTGTLIRQDGRIFSFECDYNGEAGSSEWREVSQSFRTRVRSASRTKPWDEYRIAWTLFVERTGHRPVD